MAASRRPKTNFTAGELAPELLGRGDLRAFENGARTLRNVVLQPTGGVVRRPGLRHVAVLPGPARLCAFEFNTEQVYLLVFLPGRVRVFRGDAQEAEMPGPWTADALPSLSWTQNADTLLLFHPEMAPQRITRTGAAAWTMANMEFSRRPWFRFAGPEVSIAASATTGTATLAASADVFRPGHVNEPFRLGGKTVVVSSVLGPRQAVAEIRDEALANTDPTTDWDEVAFSTARGYPVSACFHQDRLVLGGSRDLPNRLWLSRSGDLGDFDLGTGLDDQGIEFGLLSDQVNAIRAVFSGRHLQVFTSGGEWMVSGDPLTPGSIQLRRQTRVGSSVERMIPPVDVDGSTIFAARSGREIVEFAYTDVADTYQAGDLAMLARHLVRAPVSMAYDQLRRLLHVAMADGSLATVTLYRAESVTGWTSQSTDGAVRALAELDGVVWAVVEREGTPRLERFDPSLSSDAALTGADATPRTRWGGLGHLEGRTVTVLADGAPRGPHRVVGGAVTLEDPAVAIEAGLAFAHAVEPLPVEPAGQAGVAGGPRRLVSATFRLLNTQALSVDLGRGARPVPLRRLDTPMLDAPPPVFTGDVTLRGIGWGRDALRPLWRVSGEDPLLFCLLSVTIDLRTTD